MDVQKDVLNKLGLNLFDPMRKEPRPVPRLTLGIRKLVGV